MTAEPGGIELAADRLLARAAALTDGLRRLEDWPVAVYLVGGAVRDLALGRTPSEFDLMVEGNADEVARALSGGEAATVQSFARFGTATVSADGRIYDVAQARRERYPQPGALPEVEIADAHADLGRRDFTVNAIALGLGGAARGRLLSVPEAEADLVAHRLRVLHPESFLDDPTRLLRLARYAGRLGFGLEPGTRTLAVAAVAQGALNTVSGSRLGAELTLLAAEPDPVPAFGWLSQIGIGPALATGFGVHDPAVAARALRLLPGDGDRIVLVLGIAVHNVPEGSRERLLQRLALPSGRRDGIRAVAAQAAGLAVALAAAGAPSEIAAAVGPASPETVALAGAMDQGAERAARTWLVELRHAQLSITGDDLIDAGVPAGPAIGTGLAAARAALLDGRARGREHELAEALRAALA